MPQLNWLMIVSNGRFLWKGWWICKFNISKKFLDHLRNYLLFKENSVPHSSLYTNTLWLPVGSMNWCSLLHRHFQHNATNDAVQTVHHQVSESPHKLLAALQTQYNTEQPTGDVHSSSAFHSDVTIPNIWIWWLALIFHI